MKVLGQSITELPRTPEEVELAVIAGSTAAISGLLFLIGKEESGAEKVAAWSVAGIFILAGVGAAVKLCLAGKK
jgi:hypothetical protein